VKICRTAVLTRTDRLNLNEKPSAPALIEVACVTEHRLEFITYYPRDLESLTLTIGDAVLSEEPTSKTCFALHRRGPSKRGATCIALGKGDRPDR